MGQLIELAAAHPFWVWAALGAALLTTEVSTGSGWLLWPAASAGVVALVTLATPLDWTPASMIFAGLTIVTTYVARRYMKRIDPHHGHDINDQVGRLMGHHGKTVGVFADGAGRVFIDGKEWAAELEGDAALPAGAAVEVTGVSGARLTVRPAH